MKKIITFDEIEQLVNSKDFKSQKKVLAGGCFDILHPGHVEFLKRSKSKGNFLVILLESDDRVARLKGPGRPIHSQIDRAFLLSHLEMVDVVILLPDSMEDEDYYKLVNTLKPAIIAVTAPDPLQSIKKDQAEKIGAKLISVMDRNQNYSTEKIVKKL